VCATAAPALRDARTVRLHRTHRYAAVLVVRADPAAGTVSVKVIDPTGLPTRVQVVGPRVGATVVAFYPPRA
jgi:hypothetical protein